MGSIASKAHRRGTLSRHSSRLAVLLSPIPPMSQLLQPDDTGPAPELASFEATFRAHCTGLCEFVYAYVRSREIAQELVQDLFLRLWELQGTPTEPPLTKS